MINLKNVCVGDTVYLCTYFSMYSTLVDLRKSIKVCKIASVTYCSNEDSSINPTGCQGSFVLVDIKDSFSGYPLLINSNNTVDCLFKDMYSVIKAYKKAMKSYVQLLCNNISAADKYLVKHSK